ncbi:Crp/Fnr family transcriptional regulator [Mesorhizobium sp. WSM2239]|uniref:Crp/Fnr family transcriptional regulator n=2 Tax=unclassified Mesorhizobium TaxID=325217 RepID=A0AAU8DI34_9HYPH
MPVPKNDPYNNLLLCNMSGRDLALLEPHMERVGLKLKDCLERRGSLVRFVHFLEQGVASIVVKMAGRGNAEAGLLGFEGMAGTSMVLGDDTSIHDCVVQLPGEAIRIPAEAFRNALKQSPTLREFLLRYVEALGVQTAYTAIANARLTIEERLARWFLMCHDRVAGDSLPLTHDFLAVMLGVRRPGVTVGIQVLEGKLLIRANRGEIVIRDRDGLIELAGETYSEPKAQYDRLLGRDGGASVASA